MRYVIVSATVFSFWVILTAIAVAGNQVISDWSVRVADMFSIAVIVTGLLSTFALADLVLFYMGDGD